MANCKKYTRAACGHLFKHYERAKDENGEYVKFGNQDIDVSRTHLNYNLAPMQVNGQGGFIKERCSEVKMQNRKDVNVMCSWVLTAPKEIKPNETEQFFKGAYNFFADRYGRDNVVSAYVHMDEITPHIHFAFVPIVCDKKKDILKVSAKEAINRVELSRFHNDLSGYMENIFGRDVGILNESTKEGNKAIEELKRGTARQQLEEIQKETDKRVQESKQSSERIEALKTKEKELKNEIRELEKLYKGKKLTAEDLERIQPTKGLFGDAKNIKYADIANLKKTAITNLQDKIALNAAEQEIERLNEMVKQLKTAKADLTKQNAELKKKVPTMAQQMEQNGRKIKIQDLERSQREANYLKKQIMVGINQLPEQAREIMMNIIEPPEERERRRLRDDVER